MKSFGVIVIFGLLGLVAFSTATDYCDKSLCKDAVHIGCNNTGEFNKTCSADRELVEIPLELKKAIVLQHNRLRQDLANGNETDFDSCIRMASMQWNNELAYLAELNVKRCMFAHDACHNTVSFPQSGQNLAITSSTVKFTAPASEIIEPLIESWWSEKKDTTMDDIHSYPMNPKAVIGHFTVMAKQGNNRVGCAVAKYKDDYYNFLFACNYAETNIYSRPIYISGQAATDCETGTNRNFGALCSQNETYSRT